MAQNWNSKTKEFTNVKGKETKILGEKAKQLRSKGMTYEEIGEKLGRSASRAYQLCMS